MNNVDNPAPGLIPHTCRTCKYLDFYADDAADPICTHPRATTQGTRKQPIFTAVALFHQSHCRNDFYRSHAMDQSEHGRLWRVQANDIQQQEYREKTPIPPLVTS